HVRRVRRLARGGLTADGGRLSCRPCPRCSAREGRDAGGFLFAAPRACSHRRPRYAGGAEEPLPATEAIMESQAGPLPGGAGASRHRPSKPVAVALLALSCCLVGGLLGAGAGLIGGETAGRYVGDINKWDDIDGSLSGLWLGGLGGVIAGGGVALAIAL